MNDIVSHLFDRFDKYEAENKELRSEIERLRAALLKPPRHKFWGAGEPDCPPEIRASNGELHSVQCKRCGLVNPKNDICLAALEAKDE